ncbi:uncharacterized protein LOC124537856 isoform X1 [Vanessa cardui]|uniref:uncharacterized protein LOC124537856 isoform X1 n=1 Tax=Vanessa cardui TaxID=171605 RepID=UPI001F141B28|nr:uncharacterized protein LOC124537856 isoform X1 [Vanessa cardui]
METFVVQEFLDFFQNFINLCLKHDWPSDHTTPEEFRNAFLISQHIEKCLDKFHKRSLIDELLSSINKKQNTSSLFLKKCFSDPPKYILKKIFNSSINITQVNVGITIFLDLFSEQKLEDYLSDLMLEAASKETLLKNLKTEIPNEVLLDLKSKFLLSELKDTDNAKIIIENFSNTDNDMDMLVRSLLCKDFKYAQGVDVLSKAFESYMKIRSASRKSFWKLLFTINEDNFLQLCLNHGDIFKLISKALIDSGKLVRENMSMDYFYIELTYSELQSISQTICKNENLKLDFLDQVLESNEDFTFWNNFMS